MKQIYLKKKFAELVGLHRTYISSLERGKRNPTITIIFKKLLLETIYKIHNCLSY